MLSLSRYVWPWGFAFLLLYGRSQRHCRFSKGNRDIPCHSRELVWLHSAHSDLAEATMALSFLGGFYLKIAGWMGLALMAGFGVATASAAVRGVVVNCNCFGASGAEATSMQGWLRWTFLTVGVGLVCIWTTTPMWPSAASVVQLDVWIAGACMAVACASVTRLFDPMVWHWKTGNAASDGDLWA